MLILIICSKITLFGFVTPCTFLFFRINFLKIHTFASTLIRHQ